MQFRHLGLAVSAFRHFVTFDLHDRLSQNIGNVPKRPESIRSDFLKKIAVTAF